jgi:hypothetical protein
LQASERLKNGELQEIQPSLLLPKPPVQLLSSHNPASNSTGFSLEQGNSGGLVTSGTLKFSVYQNNEEISREGNKQCCNFNAYRE